MKTRRAPSRHSRGARVDDHTTTAMHKLKSPPPPPQSGARSQLTGNPALTNLSIGSRSPPPSRSGLYISHSLLSRSPLKTNLKSTEFTTQRSYECPYPPPSPRERIICHKAHPRFGSLPHMRFLVGCSLPFMPLAEHLTAFRAWCTRCLPGR